MSYTNPKQYIDTQSGQYIREMQKSVAASYGKMAGSIAEIARKTAEETLARETNAASRTSKLRNNLFAQSKNNRSIDYTTAANAQLAKYEQLAKLKVNKLTAEDRQFMANVETMGTSIRTNLEDLMAKGQTYLDAAEIGSGNEGGLDKYNSPKVLETNDIAYDWKNTPGSKTADIDCSGNSGCQIKVTSYKEGETEGVGSIGAQSEARIVPNSSKNRAELKKLTDVIDFASITSDVYKGQEKKTFNDGKATVTQVFPDKEVIRPFVESQARAWIESLTPAEASIYFNNRLAKKEKDLMFAEIEEGSEELLPIASWKTDDNGKINDSRREDIVQAYIQNVLDTTPEYNKALTTSRVNNPRPSKTANKQSQVDKRTKDATKKFKKVLDWDGKGNPPVTTIMAANNQNQQLLWRPAIKGGKIIEDTETGEESLSKPKAARWVLREKEKGGWNTIGVYPPNALEKIANQLGYDVQGVSKEDKQSALDKWENRTDNINKSNEADKPQLPV